LNHKNGLVEGVLKDEIHSYLGDQETSRFIESEHPLL
jgi:hypothetical protein